MKRHCIYQKSCKYSTHGFFNLVSNPFVYKVSFIKKIIQYSKDMLPPFDCKMTFHVISALRWQLKKRQELCILKFNIMARFQQCTAACYVKLWYLCWTCGCSFLLWGKSVENCWFYGSLLKNNISHTQTEKFTGLQGANYNHFLRSNADVFCWHRFAYGFFFSYCFPFFSYLFQTALFGKLSSHLLYLHKTYSQRKLCVSILCMGWNAPYLLC